MSYSINHADKVSEDNMEAIRMDERQDRARVEFLKTLKLNETSPFEHTFIVSVLRHGVPLDSIERRMSDSIREKYEKTTEGK